MRAIFVAKNAEYIHFQYFFNFKRERKNCYEQVLESLVGHITPLSELLADISYLKNQPVFPIKSLYSLSLNSIATNVISLELDAKREFLSSILYPDIQRDIMIEILKINCKEPCAPLASVLIKRRELAEAYKVCPMNSQQKYLFDILLGNFNGKSSDRSFMKDAKCTFSSDSKLI